MVLWEGASPQEVACPEHFHIVPTGLSNSSQNQHVLSPGQARGKKHSRGCEHRHRQLGLCTSREDGSHSFTAFSALREKAVNMQELSLYLKSCTFSLPLGMCDRKITNKHSAKTSVEDVTINQALVFPGAYVRYMMPRPWYRTYCDEGPFSSSLVPHAGES